MCWLCIAFEVQCDTYTVSSFDDIESYFRSSSIANYAYVYAVQPPKKVCLHFVLCAWALTTSLLIKRYAKDGGSLKMNYKKEGLQS